MIELAISCNVSREFKAAEESDWQPICREVNGKMEKTGREWAEVCFISNEIAFSTRGPEYRYTAAREALKDQTLRCGGSGTKLWLTGSRL